MHACMTITNDACEITEHSAYAVCIYVGMYVRTYARTYACVRSSHAARKGEEESEGERAGPGPGRPPSPSSALLAYLHITHDTRPCLAGPGK